MEEISLLGLVNRESSERFLVEASIDHLVCSVDPLSEKILKGQRGIAYHFWFFDFEEKSSFREVAISVQWRPLPYDGCNYFQIYYDGEIISPLREINFLKKLSLGEHCDLAWCACPKLYSKF